MSQAPLFSASRVLGSRAGSVAVRVSGCPGAAWVWRPAYRPGGSVRAGMVLALRVPASAAAPRGCAAAVARWCGPSRRVALRRAPGGGYWLRVSGPSLGAVAAWWSSALALHSGGAPLCVSGRWRWSAPAWVALGWPVCVWGGGCGCRRHRLRSRRRCPGCRLAGVLPVPAAVRLLVSTCALARPLPT